MTLPLKPAQAAIGHLAPRLAELTDDLLYADIWQRELLTPRERSIATVSALLAQYRPEQLPLHLQKARDNGLSVEALAELCTHLAFYAGWPAAYSALSRLDQLVKEA